MRAPAFQVIYMQPIHRLVSYNVRAFPKLASNSVVYREHCIKDSRQRGGNDGKTLKDCDDQRIMHQSRWAYEREDVNVCPLAELLKCCLACHSLISYELLQEEMWKKAHGKVLENVIYYFMYAAPLQCSVPNKTRINMPLVNYSLVEILA